VNGTITSEIAMLYYWWLFSVLTPVFLIDALTRNSPLYAYGAWPLGFDFLANDY
jgi:hypothetical protein